MKEAELTGDREDVKKPGLREEAKTTGLREEAKTTETSRGSCEEAKVIETHGRTVPVIGIVILQYRTWELTKRCVRSIAENPPEEGYRIFLVDNHSECKPPYDLRKFIEQYHIKFIRNKRNLGYNGGNNVGIRAALKAGCKCILFTNNDIVFRRNAIQYLWEGLGNAIGITCPQIIEENGSIHRYHMMRPLTLADKYLVTTKLNLLFRKRYISYYGWDRDYRQPFPVFAAHGSCVMISAACAKAVMPFDEAPFLYEEEQMLGIRLRKTGYKEEYIPKAKVDHLHGGSTRQIKAFSFAHNVRSEIYFCRQYLQAERWQIMPLYCYRLVLYLLRCVKDEDFRKSIKKSIRIMREGYEI